MKFNSDHTFYFVRFPIGGGGVHLANIVSLDPNCAPRFSASKADYVEYLSGHYQKSTKNSHLPRDHAMVNDAEWQQYFDSIDPSYSASVHTGHAASFDWAQQRLDQLINKRYLLLTFNTARSREILITRERELFGTETLVNRYYREELCSMYNSYFSSPNGIDDDVNLPIEIEQLFQPNIHKIVDAINLKYNLSIPGDLAQHLHTMWYQNIASKTINKDPK